MFESIKDIIKGYIDLANGRSVVIYGMGKVGTILYDELKSINPLCIDNNKSEYEKSDILINNVQKYYVIVTPIFSFEEIEKEIQKYKYSEVSDYVCLGKLSPVLDWHREKEIRNTFSGNYSKWEDAETLLGRNGYREGYSDDSIMNTVLKATKSVISGEAAYERDGVLFYKKAWNMQVLSAFYYITQNIRKPKICVVDFGGALGSTYFQHRNILKNIDWSIIEQEAFVDIGIKEIQEISFFKDIQEYIDTGNECDVLYMSGVLMYLDTPYVCLEKLIQYKFKYVLIDRTYFNITDDDMLCIQNVPDEIYHGSYPAWLLSEKNIKNLLETNGYHLVNSWFSTLENEEKECLYLEKDRKIPIPGKGMFYALGE